MSDPEQFTVLQQSAPLRDQVHEALERMIIDGTLAPGQRLVEGELATRLGVSRNPVREALNGLSRSGWVELRPRHGAYVRRQTAREGDEFFHVRRMLEVESARLAAVHATDRAVAQLRDLLAEGWDALEVKDQERLLAANSRFHADVVAMADNGVLAEILALLDKRLRWYFKPVVILRGPDSWQEHTDLVEAIAARDPEQAAEMMRLHTEGTRRAYLAQADEAE